MKCGQVGVICVSSFAGKFGKVNGLAGASPFRNADPEFVGRVF